MKSHCVLFFTYFDDYLDVCLNLNGDDGFGIIRQMKLALIYKKRDISLQEYHSLEADIFIEYLKLIGVA